jgi:hypothetical protein
MPGKRNCIYCGQPTGRGSEGEHIIPQAIDGGLTLNDKTNYAVCKGCNGGVLSVIDEELCKRSFLSMVACQVLSKPLHQSWSCDYECDRVLYEVNQVWRGETLETMICYPQIIFEKDGVKSFRGDLAEMQRLGDNYFSIVHQAARHALEAFNAGAKGRINLERLKSTEIPKVFRFPPRLFSRKTVTELSTEIEKASFILRFLTPDDKDFALSQLTDLVSLGRKKHTYTGMGGMRPATGLYFDRGRVVRALIKIGINTIAAFCPNTLVSRSAFDETIPVVMDEVQIKGPYLRMCGFIRAEGLASFAVAWDNHTIRLVYDLGNWHVYFSFFGGLIGAYVVFSGPNGEQWRTADIVAPLKSKNWTITTRKDVAHPQVEVTWTDQPAIMPSMKLQNSTSVLRTEERPDRKPKGSK